MLKTFSLTGICFYIYQKSLDTTSFQILTFCDFVNKCPLIQKMLQTIHGTTRSLAIAL